MSNDRVNGFLSRTTLRQIEIVAALQKHGSITKAAEALGMSVANVSRASKRFETNLDIRLFEGEDRRLILREDASQIFDRFARLTNEIVNLREDLCDTFQIARKCDFGSNRE